MEYQNENFNGEYDFRSRFHEGYHMQEHLHEYSELLYCKEGHGTVTVNGQTVSLIEGQLIWIPPNYIHQYDFDQAKLVCAVFSNDLIPLFFKALAGRHFCVSAVNMEELKPVLDRFYTLQKEDSLTVSGYLNLIGAKVLAAADFEKTRHTDGILYQKVIFFLAEHYTESITLSQVAKHFGYNKKYLSHALHELTGIHFRQLLSFYRVNHAKRLLENEPSMDITTIATESGFEALNTFHRAFRSATGMTPSEYRSTYAKP